MKKVLISSCLFGKCVRYDGGDNKIENSSFIDSLHVKGLLVDVCPEVDGGLPTPRIPCEIEEGFSGADVLQGNAKVVNKIGEDKTKEFVEGANIALHVSKSEDIKMVILKASSPSCGNKTIYNGTHSGVKKEGEGVCAALLRDNGIKVFSEKELDEALTYWEDL